MKTIKILVACASAWLVWAPVTPACAQKVSITERFDAPRLKKNIYLQLDNNVIHYKHDEERSNWNNLGQSLKQDESPLWLAKNGTVMLYIGFYNPYQYAVSVSSEMADDEINEATEQFGSHLFAMLNTVSGVPVPGVPGLTSPEHSAKFIGALEPLSADEIREVVESFKSLSIIQWKLETEQIIALQAKEKGKPVCLNENDIKKIMNIVRPVEQLLYGKIEADTVPRTFADHVNDVIKVLTRATTYKTFKSDLKLANDRISKLEEAVSNGQKSLESLNGTSNPFTNAKGCNVFEAFEPYHDAIMKQYYAEGKQRTDDMIKVIAALKEFKKIGDDFLTERGIKNSEGELEGIIYQKELSPDFDHINTVTITVDEQKVDPKQPVLTSSHKFSTKFRIARFRSSWPELSTGLSYTNVSYYSYSTGDASTTGTTTTYKIVEKESKQHVLAAIFYDQVFDVRAHNLFPLFHIGAGSTKDFPSLMFGGGVRLVFKNFSRLSFSGGVTIPFVKTLKTLEPGGDVESQATLDANIHYTVRNVAPYFGLAWKVN